AHHDLPQERLTIRSARVGRADVGDVAERGPQQSRGRYRADELRRPVGESARPGEVASECEREGDRGVEVGAADVADSVDPEHDYQTEGEGDADVAELVGLGVDHDRAAAGEDERERAYGLRHEGADER